MLYNVTVTLLRTILSNYTHLFVSNIAKSWDRANSEKCRSIAPDCYCLYRFRYSLLLHIAF